MSVHGTSEVVGSGGNSDQRGGWLDSVLTIGSTIGAISNVLSGVRGGTEVVDFGPLGKGKNPGIGAVVFWNDKDGQTWALNQSTEEGATIFFPNDLAEEEGELVYLPPAEKILISQFFREHARVDCLSITPTGEGHISERPNAGGPRVRASTRQLVPSQAWVKLGSAFQVKIVASSNVVLLVATGSLGLAAVTIFRIRDVGGAVAEVINAWI